MLTTSDFYTWFNLREIGRMNTPNGVLVQLEPGGDQEQIDLVLWLDTTKTIVVKGTLMLNRAWVGEGRVNPFAIDIAASFLRALGQDAPLALELADQISGLTASHSSTPVLQRAQPTAPIDRDSRDAMPPKNIDAFLAAFLSGSAGGAESITPRECRVGLSNRYGDARSLVCLEVSYAAEDCIDPLTGRRDSAKTIVSGASPAWWRKLFRR